VTGLSTLNDPQPAEVCQQRAAGVQFEGFARSRYSMRGALNTITGSTFALIQHWVNLLRNSCQSMTMGTRLQTVFGWNIDNRSMESYLRAARATYELHVKTLRQILVTCFFGLQVYDVLRETGAFRHDLEDIS
jgi:hypothetical protein